MPRFYLNPIFTGRPIRDHDGEEHPGLDDARRSAIRGAREILAGQLRGDEVSFRGVEIADQNGVVLEVIGISEVLRGPR
jgi:hypothetical protein